MQAEFELIAKTFQGLEEVLAKELIQLGANDVQIGCRMVSFTGNKELMYRTNFALRTAVRILKPIKRFKANSAEEVYDAIKSIEWSNYLDVKTSFVVDAVVFSEEFRHSKFVAYKVKDAIADYFREKTGERPNISVSHPDIRLNIHVAENKCTLSLDSSGTSLHQRGYRQEAVEAPLNEVLAAGMILMTGWNGECDFIDPMCGSGTLPIEAALIARNIYPGVFRKEYAFEKWKDFDQELFDSIYNDDSQEREFEHKIYGYDNSPKAVALSNLNVKAAGLTRWVEIALRPFEEFEQPATKSIIVMNPPYGERISSPDILGLYKTIGERLKHHFIDNEAWVLSFREECFEAIGLKPSLKTPLFNGALECELRKYQIFSGKYKEVREEGIEIKTEEDLKLMAEAKRFKTHREGFKKRSDDDELEGEGESRPRRERRSFDGERKPFDRDRKPFDRDRKPFDRDRKPFDRDRKPFDRDRKPFDRDRKPFDRDRKPFDRERKPFDRDRKPFDGERKPFDRERKPFDRDRKPFDRDRKPFDRDRKPFDRDRKPFGGERKRFDRDRKPFGHDRKPSNRNNNDSTNE